MRLQILSADSGAQSIDANNTQQITIKEIPVEVGLMWSPISSHSFRFGIGPYLGAAVSAKATVSRTLLSTGTVSTVEYSTIDWCGSLAAQMVFGLGEAFGFFLQGDYRYDQTGTTPATTVIINAPGFKINYSGIVLKAGLELRL
jgi:hypothetical protein